MTNSIPIAINIAISEARSRIAELPEDSSIEEHLRLAMLITKSNWACTSEDEQFKSAVCAVMIHYGEGSPEWGRLSRELQQLGQLSIILSAAQAGLGLSTESLDAMAEDCKAHQPIGLMKIWHEVGRNTK